jgi:sialic acid synthase SpsE
LPPFVIAEIGVNHDGDMCRARELIHAARLSGADAAKFQMFDASLLMSLDSVLAIYQRERGARDPRELLQGLQLTPAQLGELAEECVRVGLVPMVTVFSLPLVAMAREQPWQVFKMASPDIVHRPLLQGACRSTRNSAWTTRGHPLLQGAPDHPTPPRALSLHTTLCWTLFL